MKKLIKIMLIVVLCVGYSCSKDDDGGSNTIEGTVNLISVPDNGTDASVLPTFSWETTVDADIEVGSLTYNLFLGTEPEPTTLVGEDLNDVAHTVTETLTLNQKYYWKVTAKDAEGETFTSETFSFTTTAIDFSVGPITEEAEFGARFSHTSVVFDNKLWVIAGEHISFSRERNDIWTSEDGITWGEVDVLQSFPARGNHTSVVFDNKIWVIGGLDAESTSDGILDYKDDIWYSEDGSTWTEVVVNNGFPARAFHTSVVFDNKIWVIGGFDGEERKNDVWFSEDGSNWTEATTTGIFSARIKHSSVVFDDKIWIIGGLGIDGDNYNDVWSSPDGVNWTEVNTDASFLGRNEHTTVVFNDKMWLIAGVAQKTNDIWSSSDGVTWVEAASDPSFPESVHHSSVVYNDKLFVIGGRVAGSAVAGSPDRDRDNVWAYGVE